MRKGFIADELNEEHVVAACKNRVHRLCSVHGIFSVLGRTKARRPRPGERPRPPGRSLGAAAPNELWFADITEHCTDETKLYRCAIKDAFSGRIVGFRPSRVNRSGGSPVDAAPGCDRIG